jgi:hypothetical protein
VRFAGRQQGGVSEGDAEVNAEGEADVLFDTNGVHMSGKVGDDGEFLGFTEGLFQRLCLDGFEFCEAALVAGPFDLDEQLFYGGGSEEKRPAPEAIDEADEEVEADGVAGGAAADKVVVGHAVSAGKGLPAG